MLSVGIVGLPNAGKSTLFNALLSRRIASVAPYPFCTIEPNKGVVEVPDPRLPVLAKVVNTEKIVPAVVEFVDIAGLVAGAHKGEGLGNQFLAHVRECSAIVHVLRAFKDENVAREGVVDPESDFEIVKTELCLADLHTLEKQKPPNPAVASKAEAFRWQTILKIKEVLGQDREVRSLAWSEEEQAVIGPLFLLSAKPAILVLNVEEREVGLTVEQWVEKLGWQPEEELIPICAKTEMELADLSLRERKEYLAELGLPESGLERLIKRGYQILDLQSFYTTVGDKEVRAWTLRRGEDALEASGAIHTDFRDRFIKARVCCYPDFVRFGGWKNCADQGRVKLEGKDYLMQEGDVVEFLVDKKAGFG